jgi:hypothetical protein
MHAEAGDWLLVNGNHVGDHDRRCQILEVRGEDGGAPYLVRWFEDGHVSLFFPGPGAALKHPEPSPTPT